MKKVMIFNFKTMQYEEASEEAAKEIAALIGMMNKDCADKHNEKNPLDNGAGK